MCKILPTLVLLESILARVPEGFIHRSTLNKHLQMQKKMSMDKLIEPSSIRRIGNIYYDTTRLTPAQLRVHLKKYRPSLPKVSEDGGTFVERPIVERLEEREMQLRQSQAVDYVRIVRAVEDAEGYKSVEDLCTQPGDERIVQELSDADVLCRRNGLVFDPLRLSVGSIDAIYERFEQEKIATQVTDYLNNKTGHTAPRSELVEKFGDSSINTILEWHLFVVFEVRMKLPPYTSLWVRLKDSDKKTAIKVARNAVRIKDEEWQTSLELCGDVLRPGAKDGKTRRAQVVARSYTVNKAAVCLGVRKSTLRAAISAQIVAKFIDAERHIRIPASEIQSILQNEELIEQIADFERLDVKDISRVTGLGYWTVVRRLQREKLSHNNPLWKDVRGKWGLPDRFSEYVEVLQTKLAEQQAAREKTRRLVEEQQAQERQRREALRARLVEAFPTWQHEERNTQQITLHIGPPNSGKTHDALNMLVEAGSGWYLAPLRLLAYEIFDRFNLKGVPCNLLTGEEYIPIEGAQFTAATIEMFNPTQSGECVVIDEAQMLADPDRGWAWTRAMMEAQAPHIHVLGPPTARELIEKMASEAAIAINVVEHKRLAPIEVVEKPWGLEGLPSHTILVAFSRRMVLDLKTDLEENGRTVSVVYGSLPPEVRRKQADRFANGETEICVATDAVGMGLNLPADCVCFFETEKFDGVTTRLLRTDEVQQIGGRAGRYGIRTSGKVGATTGHDLKQIRNLFYGEPIVLTHARVAPSVQDLEMIPGSLSTKLQQWASLQSIPNTLRNIIKTAKMDERIELAKMLTDEEVEQLGLESALKLVNAPTRQSSRAYWYTCTRSILSQRPLPLPPVAPSKIKNSRDLDTTESCISCADIYLWLSYRKEFAVYGTQMKEVRQARRQWSSYIDLALLHQLDTASRCSRCGKRLPRRHPYKICDRCYSRYL